MTAFAFRVSADAPRPFVVLLHTGETPEGDIWSQYVDVLSELLPRTKTAVPIFAVTDGGGPDSGQRRALARAFAPDRLGAMTHVFTTSSFTRGIVTAFHWVARSRAVAHLPEEFPAVCERCQTPVRAAMNELLELQKQLPPVALLAQIGSVCGVGVSREPASSRRRG
jgi:hypothetical protein